MWEMQILSTQRQHMTPPDSSQSGSEETLPLLSGERNPPPSAHQQSVPHVQQTANQHVQQQTSHVQQQTTHVQPVHVQPMTNGHGVEATVGIVTIDQETMTPLHHQTMVATQQQQVRFYILQKYYALCRLRFHSYKSNFYISITT